MQRYFRSLFLKFAKKCIPNLNFFGEPLHHTLHRVHPEVLPRVLSQVDFPLSQFNGAQDMIMCLRYDGSIGCTGIYLNDQIVRCSEECLAWHPRLQIKINDAVVEGVTISLNDISQKTPHGVPVYTPTGPAKVLIFRQLRPGRNEITFYIEGQPSSRINARIYLWERESRIIVVDVDGTITRANLKGLYHCYKRTPYFHRGASKFFRHLEALGYKFVYLTARPISIINATRMHLRDEFPDGPVFTSCDGRIISVKNYLGSKFKKGGAKSNKGTTSHYDFKAGCLTHVREVFYDNGRPGNPLHAAIGNTRSDERAYRDAGVPDDKIFTVTKGLFRMKIRHLYRTYVSYKDLLKRSDEHFPALN